MENNNNNNGQSDNAKSQWKNVTDYFKYIFVLWGKGFSEKKGMERDWDENRVRYVRAVQQ